MGRCLSTIMSALLVLTGLMHIDAVAADNVWTGGGPFATGQGDWAITTLAVDSENGSIYAGTRSGAFFTYQAAKPSATTNAATNVTLNGTVNAKNADATISFDYGATTAYGTSTAATPATATGVSDISASADITGITVGSTFHYRIVASNFWGTTYGSDEGFTATLGLSPSSLPGGTYGSSYSQAITASGGVPPYTCTVTSGSLPPGLDMSPEGLLTGTPTAPGTYTFTVQAIDASPSSGEREYTLTIKTNQTITFDALPAKTYADPDFSPGATASSGLGVSYSSSNTAVATIVGANIHIIGLGTTTITASQAGDSNYNAAPQVSQTLTVSKGNQTITFNALPAKGYGDPDFWPGATASSGRAVSYSSSNTAVAAIVFLSKIHIIALGQSTITASQAGNANYYAATPVTQILTVNKGNQTITFNTLPAKAYGAPDFQPGATASSGLAVSYISSNTTVATIVGGGIHIIASGTSTITASQAGDSNFNAAASVPQTLTVQKADQTISVTQHAPESALPDSSFTVAAAASSGLVVGITSSGGCSGSGSGSATITMTGGTTACTVYYNHSGDGNYNAAPEVTESAVRGFRITASVYSQAETTGLLGWWRLDDGEGDTAADSSGFGRNGTLTNSPAWSADKPAALTSSAGSLFFDGADDYVSAGNIDLAGKSWTISFWARSGSGEGAFIMGQGLGDLNNSLQIGFRNSDNFFCDFWGDELDIQVYVDTDWHNWAVTYNADTNARVIYRDGLPAGSDTTSADYGGTGPFYIGRSGWTEGYTFSGNIDDVRVYDSALSADAVAAIAAANPHGTISPAGASTVASGGSLSYTITPDAGYRIADVLVDLATVGTPTGYTFDNVTANHTLSATIEPKAGQTITFNTLPIKTPGDADFSPAATASSGLPVSYSSSNTAVATIVSGNIHILGAGTTTITASQPGDSDYNAAPDVSQILMVIGGMGFPPPGPTDSDNDGMPDWWETEYGLDPNDATGINGAAGDPNGDGVTNLEHFQARTQPTDPAWWQPVPVYPENGAVLDTMPPFLIVRPFVDPDNDMNLSTQWQVSASGGQEFEAELVYGIKSTEDLTETKIPALILSAGRTYFWRVRITDLDGNDSSWSDLFSFITPENTADVDGNGIEDQFEVDETVDLDQNGTPDIQEQDTIKSVNCLDGEKRMGVKKSIGVISIDAVKPVDPADIEDATGHPANMPFGLISFRLTVSAPGQEAEVVIHFSEPIPEAMKWYKWDRANGWYDDSANATFNAERTAVTLRLVDGGDGDADGVANGIIVDPSGPGEGAAEVTCFISAAMEGSAPRGFLVLILALIGGAAALTRHVAGLFLLQNSL